MTKWIDRTDAQFNDVYVIRHVDRKRVECRCLVKLNGVVCNRVFITKSNNLVTGNTTNCGCVRREKVRNYPRLASEQGYVNTLMAFYRANARTRKRACIFTLTYDEALVLFTNNCYYCDAPPSNKTSLGAGTYNDRRYSGIDRLDSNQGYISGNCVSCCKICNYAKRSMSVSEFITWIERVYAFRIKR